VEATVVARLEKPADRPVVRQARGTLQDGQHPGPVTFWRREAQRGQKEKTGGSSRWDWPARPMGPRMRCFVVAVGGNPGLEPKCQCGWLAGWLAGAPAPTDPNPWVEPLVHVRRRRPTLDGLEPGRIACRLAQYVTNSAV
jgi:hypothetical protein